MNKKLWKVSLISALAVLTCITMVSCGSTADSSSSSVTKKKTNRVVLTTKSEEYSEKVDEDDEDFEGYTTKASETAPPLENESDLDKWDDYDEDIRATMTTTTAPKDSAASSGSVSSIEKVTTAFKADVLYPLSYGETFAGPKTYKVDSDTTYLNLRYGPSTEYDVQLQIPNGITITGTGSSGSQWIYVTYNGTSGWVAKGLLIELE